MEARELILSGNAYLGIEFGSTRIKGVLIDEKGTPLASGDHEWENRFENGVWTYTLDDVWEGIADCYAKLKENVAATQIFTHHFREKNHIFVKELGWDTNMFLTNGD